MAEHSNRNYIPAPLLIRFYLKAQIPSSLCSIHHITHSMSGQKTVNDCLIAACRAEDVEKVKAAITLGCDVNYRDAKEYSHTGLMNSAGQYFNLEIMNLLLQQMALLMLTRQEMVVILLCTMLPTAAITWLWRGWGLCGEWK